jgi:hypothetical protein
LQCIDFEKYQTCEYTVRMSSNLHSKLTDGQPIPTQIDGALVQVKLLRRNGERVTDDEFRDAEAMHGRIKYVRAGGGSNWRPEHLELQEARPGIATSIHKPLFQPTFRGWDQRGIILSGWEVEVVDGRPIEHRQMWLVVPVAE